MVAPAALRRWQAGFAIALTVTALAYRSLQAAVMSGSLLAKVAPAVAAVLSLSRQYGLQAFFGG
ncbi:hypothetical protein BGV67_30915 [Burkholderia ubonensis]|nr:hypothetical protein WI78_31070 [Burkholderia ubonensis]KVD12584.1 hypothetical protein WI79_03000 [Burkholderia ubonensis]KVD44931.1 hypothetical protein WI84_32480 [Burkholderia ubonensis]KVD68129.1 hypothetical protein WI87_27885 [Burkholderia ubonensis]OJA39192.1 hypothetical protein BGV67_30915 [Burkholderia ubonensis]